MPTQKRLGLLYYYLVSFVQGARPTKSAPVAQITNMGVNQRQPGAYIGNVFFALSTLMRIFGPEIGRRIAHRGMMYVERYEPEVATGIYSTLRRTGLNMVTGSSPEYAHAARVRVKREGNTTMELPRSVAQRTEAGPVPFPQLTLPTTSSSSTSRALPAPSTTRTNNSSMLNTPQRNRRTNAQPLKVIQTVAAPTSKRSRSTRRGNTGIIFDLSRMMYPVLDSTAERGNLLLGIKCLTKPNKQNSSANSTAFVCMGPTWDFEGNQGAQQLITVFSYLWGCGNGYNNSTALNVEAQSNQFVVNFGNYFMLPKDFMPIPNAGQPTSGNNITQAPYLEIYGRSWYGDMYSGLPGLQGTVMYPDFKFCAQGCQMREYSTATGIWDSVPNALQSYAGLQGVLELDGFLQGNSICGLAQQAYDNSTLGRRVEGPSSYFVDSDGATGGMGGTVRVFDNDAICDSAQKIWQASGANGSIYSPNFNFWQGCRSVGGLDMPFMYDLKDTLHLSNGMDVPIVVNVEIFECSENIDRVTPVNSTDFYQYNAETDIMPLWQGSLNAKADDSAKLNGFYSGMVSDKASTVKAERIYDVGKSADNNKYVKKYWKCVGKKHFRLESLQETSHTFNKYDVINMKNVVDKSYQDMELGTIGAGLPEVNLLPFKSMSVTPAGTQVPLNPNVVGDILTTSTVSSLATGNPSRENTDIMLHTDKRIKKYVKGHSYKYIITWFGLKQMANDSKGLNPPLPPYSTDGVAKLEYFPDSAYVRNGRAQLVVSRSCDVQMRVGPQVTKKLFQKQRFGPVGEATGAFKATLALDPDLVGNGITRTGGSVVNITDNDAP